LAAAIIITIGSLATSVSRDRHRQTTGGGRVKSVLRLGLLGVVRLLVGAYADWQGCTPERRQRINYASDTSHFDTFTPLFFHLTRYYFAT
jgi:hypothetical protein